MSALGGSIEEVSIKGRGFAVAADADAARDVGGFTTEVASNGNGTARIIMTRKPWKVGGLSISIDDDRGDQEFLQDVIDAKAFVPMSVTLASGITYSGSGIIIGDLSSSSQSATCDVELSGAGKLEKQ